MEEQTRTPAPKLPDELLDQLHKANEHFHESKKQLDHAIDGTEYRHQERVNDATNEIRNAEHEAEEVDKKIHEALKKPE
jgi:hypothetical protein